MFPTGDTSTGEVGHTLSMNFKTIIALVQFVQNPENNCLIFLFLIYSL